MRWRSLKAATWLGWQIESNWTDPFLFAVYSIVKPLTSAGILVVMYAIVTHGNFGLPAFAYMYLGNAFYMYVGAVMTGMSHAIIDDRERYQMLRAVWVAPIDVPMYLIGRGVARFLTGSLSVFVTIVFGVLFLHVPVDPWAVRWPLFLTALSVGAVMLAMMGLLLAGLVLIITQQSALIGDAVAGALYLFSGAIFPLEVLPRYLRPIGLLLPVTYWLELLRRCLVAGVASESPMLAGVGDLQLLGILLALTFMLAVTALVLFALCDWNARERGLIDRTTNY
jgi:ABC-2 type transport system permease protein